MLGLFLYQGLMIILVSLLEMELTVAAYSFRGLLLTVALVVAVFLLSSITSALYLKKVSIYTLLHGDRVVEKRVKHPALWFCVMLLSLGAVIWSCIAFPDAIEQSLVGKNAKAGLIFSSLLVFAVGIVVFHIALARSIVNLLLRNHRFRCRGTNTFTLRQLSGKLSANSVMAGALAFLIAFAVIGANCSFVQQISSEAVLDQSYPFDISVQLEAGEIPPLDPAEAERLIDEYAGIEAKRTYSLYTLRNGYLYSFTPWTGEGYEGLYDVFMTESDVNALLRALGREPVSLDGGFLIMTNLPQVLYCDFTSAVLDLNGLSYRYTGITDDIPRLAYSYFVAVVPDEAVAGMEVDCVYTVYDVVNERYDAGALRKALSYPFTSTNGQYTYDRCDYSLREYGRQQQNSTTAILIISVLYIAVVFVFMAMAILALKTLSGLSEDRQKYKILFQLGADRRMQSRTLFRQTFSFFLLPFALPILLSVPTGFVCMKIMKLAGYTKYADRTLFCAGAIMAVMIAIYLLYFAATFLLAKRNVVQREN